jgi:hypothetical protein
MYTHVSKCKNNKIKLKKNENKAKGLQKAERYSCEILPVYLHGYN